jgi:uncharacterized membrane protein YfcA
MGILFLVASTALGVALTGHSAMSWGQGVLSAAVLAPTMLGYWIGQNYRRRLPEEQFRRVFFIALMLLGAYTLTASLRP